MKTLCFKFQNPIRICHLLRKICPSPLISEANLHVVASLLLAGHITACFFCNYWSQQKMMRNVFSNSAHDNGIAWQVTSEMNYFKFSNLFMLVLAMFTLVSFSLLLVGVALGPLSCGHFWPIVPDPDDRWGLLWKNWWNEDWQEKPKYSEKTWTSATLSTTDPTWPDPGSNPGRRGGKPATNRLSYGAPTLISYTVSDLEKTSTNRKKPRMLWIQT
jgi:hypothetical protein